MVGPSGMSTSMPFWLGGMMTSRSTWTVPSEAQVIASRWRGTVTQRALATETCSLKVSYCSSLRPSFCAAWCIIGSLRSKFERSSLKLVDVLITGACPSDEISIGWASAGTPVIMTITAAAIAGRKIHIASHLLTSVTAIMPYGFTGVTWRGSPLYRD